MQQKIKNYTKKLFIPHEGNNFKPHAIRHKTLMVMSGLLIAVKVFLVSFLFFSYPSLAEFSTITTNRIVELTNVERQDLGLGMLKHSSILDRAAKLKADDMIKNGYFAHTSPTGIKPWHWFNEVKYNYTFAGENLAMNFSDAEDAMQAWMDSPTHKENIVSSDYAEIGVAVAVGKINGHETTLVVQLFGKTYTQVAGEFFPTSPPIEGKSVTGPLSVTEEAANQEVKFEAKEKNGVIAKVINWTEKFFLVVIGFIILNLILTIIIRLEIQHKPIILHCLWVVFLSLSLIFFKMHFIERLGGVIGII